MSRHLKRGLKAIYNLGILNGLLVYYYYVYYRIFKRQRWHHKAVRINHLSAPFWLRPGVSDWIVMERIFFDREYDPVSKAHDASMDGLQARIRLSGKKPLIIDCGANIGLSSIWFAERFPDATIIAIEPEPANFRILSLNAQNFPNIVPINAAISDKITRVLLLNESDTPWGWKTQEVASGGVPTVTIQHVVNLDADYVLMAVKVDIEGFETSLLSDGAAWIDDLALLVFEMHDWMMPWSGSGHAFFSVLSRHKRDYLLRGENVFSYAHHQLLTNQPVVVG